MGIRFRRSIKICKGLRVNVNKNSVGLSFGPRGFGYSFNTKGRKTFHAGIPGTGLSYVTSNNIVSTKSSKNENNKNKQDGVSIHFELEDDGKWKYYYPNGKEITDPTLINKIKRHPDFIEQKKRILNNRSQRVAKEVEDYNLVIKKLININKMSAYPLLEYKDYENAMNQVKLETYKEKEYDKPRPTLESVTQILTREAKDNVKDIKFWDLNKRRKEYVQSIINERLENATKAWELNKEKFDEKEKENASIINKELKEEYDSIIDHYKKIINGDEEIINDEIESFLSNIELPLEFNINYSYSKSNNTLSIDLDLPEIEDMPSETATQLSNGMKKMKQKTKQELKDDYEQFVFGFALFLTSHLFNISPQIYNIIISGYTQRRDKNDELKDDYIYSIIFEREKFKKYNPIEDNTVYVCNRFKNRCNVDMYSNFKSIEPYTNIEE